MWQEYLYPVTVAEAVQMLADHGGRARVIAGGTDLVPQLKSGERQASCLVDISRIEELRGIAQTDEIITVGAATTHAEVAASPLIRERATVLAQAAAEVGSPQIRNSGTLGGNIVNAQPAADTALALLALDAQAEVVGSGGADWLPLSGMYAGPGVSRVDSSVELVRAFRFRALREQAGSSYRRLGKCKSIALPVLCAAAVVRLDGAEFVSAAISLGPVAPQPWRAAAAEAWLASRPADDESIAQAAKLARQYARPRSSLLRCSSAYRTEMVAVLVRDTLSNAVAAARR